LKAEDSSLLFEKLMSLNRSTTRWLWSSAATNACAAC